MELSGAFLLSMSYDKSEHQTPAGFPGFPFVLGAISRMLEVHLDASCISFSVGAITDLALSDHGSKISKNAQSLLHKHNFLRLVKHVYFGSVNFMHNNVPNSRRHV